MVWFDSRSIANILSLALLMKEFFDSAVENVFLVFKEVVMLWHNG